MGKKNIKCYFLTDKKIVFTNDFFVLEKPLGNNFFLYTIKCKKETNKYFIDNVCDFICNDDNYFGFLFFEKKICIVFENEISCNCECLEYDYSGKVPLYLEYEGTNFGKKYKSSFNIIRFKEYMNFLPEEIKNKLKNTVFTE